MSSVLAECEWVASWFGLAKDLHYDLRQRDTLNREIKVTSIMSSDDSELNMKAITDAKSMYENLNREQFTGAEKKGTFGDLCDSGLFGISGWTCWMGSSRRESS